MSDAGLALQEALHAALSSLAGALVTGVYDGPPAGAVPPYLTIGPDLVTDISTKTEQRRQHLYAVTAWAAGDAVSVGDLSLNRGNDRGRVAFPVLLWIEAGHRKSFDGV